MYVCVCVCVCMCVYVCACVKAVIKMKCSNLKFPFWRRLTHNTFTRTLHMIMLDLCTHLCVSRTPAIITDGTPLTLDKDLHTSLAGRIPINQADGGRGLNTLCGRDHL